MTEASSLDRIGTFQGLPVVRYKTPGNVEMIVFSSDNGNVAGVTVAEFNLLALDDALKQEQTKNTVEIIHLSDKFADTFLELISYRNIEADAFIQELDCIQSQFDYVPWYDQVGGKRASLLLLCDDFKGLAGDMCLALPNCAERTIALAKLQEVQMWVTKGVFMLRGKDDDKEVQEQVD